VPADASFVDGDDAERHELAQRIRAKFDVVEQSLTVGSVSLRALALRDPDSLLDAMTIEQSHSEMDWQPYWGKVWASALGLGEWLAARELGGLDVADLGCGLGIPGAVAAARGAKVWLLDNALPALEFVQWNVWPWRERTTIVAIDWRRHAELSQSFDLILGSDILYSRDDIPHLDRFWRRHLRPEGMVVLSEPGRLMTGDLLPEVQAAGWSVVSSSMRVGPDHQKVTLMQLTASSR
jgi:predicted nicotinamide N-methyase